MIVAHRPSALGRKPLFRPPAFIGIFHNPTLRKSGLIQGTITDYCTDGETEYRRLFHSQSNNHDAERAALRTALT